MIKYLGSKRTLVPLLVDVALALGPPRTALDLLRRELLGISVEPRYFRERRVPRPLGALPG